MEASHGDKTVGDFIMLHRAGMLKVNPEYQRGVVWGKIQKRKLVDSVLRGYPLPLIYLNHTRTEVAGMRSEGLEIIDGQQRINALYEFFEGGFTLLDPIKDDQEAKFPAFIRVQPCPWGGKDFGSLPADLQEQFMRTPLRTAHIKTSQPNEVRDLFVRLQSGLPLNAQETRDAWPGQFTDFILWLGGKPELPRYPGHEFFRGPLGMRAESDRGKTRLLAAQIATLFLSRRECGADHFSDIGSNSITEFYYKNIDFDRNSPDARRLCQVLDKLSQLLQAGQRPKLKAHDAIHLVLLVDALWDDYTRSWEERLPQALDRFLAELALAKKQRDNVQPNEFWVRYGQWTRVNSDRGARIAHRHRFYMEKMLSYLQPLQLKDPARKFGELERTVLFYQQGKRCAVCGAPAAWSEVEVHHVAEHAKGGATDLRNGAVVHRHCHPHGAAATRAFALKFLSRQVLDLDEFVARAPHGGAANAAH